MIEEEVDRYATTKNIAAILFAFCIVMILSVVIDGWVNRYDHTSNLIMASAVKSAVLTGLASISLIPGRFGRFYSQKGRYLIFWGIAIVLGVLGSVLSPSASPGPPYSTY